MEFRRFHERLLARFGAEAAAARHEIFFITRRRSRLPAPLRALLAALRDARLCLRLPAAPVPSCAVIAVASRPGASGLQALGPALRALSERGIPSTLVVHPRLRGASGASLIARPKGVTWGRALAAFRMPLAGSWAEAFIIRCCVFRLRLWQGAWQATLSARQEGALVLHNDFELFCVAAIKAGAGRWDSLCVQHGLPTDEFFPTRARLHLVWGETSRVAYAGRGAVSDALLFGPVRPRKPAAGGVPATIRLVSQTHTPVYGRSLARDFLSLAQALARQFPDPAQFAILLHPEEVRLGHPYRGNALATFCRRPPHPELLDGARPVLFVGFCSTALVEAACRGHLVVGMEWDVPASHAALAVGRPPLTAPDPDSLCDMLKRLLGDRPAFAAALACQEEWLQRSFASGEAWLDELGQWR